MSFKAARPWSVNPNETPLLNQARISQQELEKLGYQHNTTYSSVNRLNPAKDCHDRLPDHLTLPAYSDVFIAG